ncbi:MAG TPA: alanine racemase [Chthonomonadaceae bacterium]|nr:alanine racemase [Chthonomonadaceae bacterium]
MTGESITYTTQRRAWARVDLDAVRANVAALRAFLGPAVRLMAVVKADAYGHGLVPVARAALEAGAAWLGAATVAEGVALREAGLAAPIALLCAPLPDEAEAALTWQLTVMAGDSDTLQALSRAIARLRALPETPAVHLEVDTGMGRSGILPDQALDLWRATSAAGLRVTGLTTHFADADGADLEFTAAQQSAFDRVRTALEQAGARFEIIHLPNSAATLRFGAAGGNLVRPGLLLYGILPPIPNLTAPAASAANSPSLPALQPVLTLAARVATVRTLPAGHPISYGVTHRLARPSRVATVLIGYGDGYPRRLSNRGAMLLRGKRAPILGRVCMDQTVIDVTDIPGVEPGEEAVCIGSQGDDRISIEEIAAVIDTTEHEISTCLTPRVARIFSGAEPDTMV